MDFPTNRITNEKLDMMALESNYPMNTLGISMSYTYIASTADIGWCDVLFAVDNGFLTHESAIEHAINEIKKTDSYPIEVFELACIFKSEAQNHVIHQLLLELTRYACDIEIAEAKSGVLYILLNWVFEHRYLYEDPLRVVEFIYDDFGFPDLMRSFVRYVPNDNFLSCSIGLSKDRVYCYWSKFLDLQKAKYSITG